MAPKRAVSKSAQEVKEVVAVDSSQTVAPEVVVGDSEVVAVAAPKRPPSKRAAKSALSTHVVIDESSNTAAPAPRAPSKRAAPKPKAAPPAVVTTVSDAEGSNAGPPLDTSAKKRAQSKPTDAKGDAVAADKPAEEPVAVKKPRAKSTVAEKATAEPAEGTLPTAGAEQPASLVKKPRAKPSSPGAPAGVCSECGLQAPFCAMSGKPHVFAMMPCPKCHQNTLFCAETGERHPPLHGPLSEGVGAAAKASERPVKQPRSAPSASSAAPADGEAPTKKRRDEKKQLLLLPLSGSTEPADSSAVAESAVPAGRVKKPRSKVAPADGTKSAEASDAQAVDEDAPKGKRQRQQTLDETLSSKSSTAALLEPLPPQPFVYPPLKPVLGKVEHHAFIRCINAEDSLLKKRMTDAGVTAPPAQKRFAAFVGMYTSEKGKQEMVAAYKHAQAAANPAAADVTIVDPSNPSAQVEEDRSLLETPATATAAVVPDDAALTPLV